MMKKLLIVHEPEELAGTRGEQLRMHGYVVRACLAHKYPAGSEGFHPDSVLYAPVDIEGGPELLSTLKQRHPRARVVVYSSKRFLAEYKGDIEGIGATTLEMPKRPAEIAAALE